MIDRIADIFFHYNDKIMLIVFIAIGALLLALLVDLFFKPWVNHAPTKRAKTLIAVLSNFIKTIVYVIAFMFTLTRLGINVTPLLASAGIAGLAIGFGSQLLIRDIITGVFLILENQFNAGDRVRVDKVEGVVESIGLRTTTIRDDQGALNILPNGSLNQIANISRSWSQANITITVPAKNNVDKVLTILENTAKVLENDKDHSDDMLLPAKVEALETLDGGTMTFRILIRTKNENHDEVARKYRYLVKKAFEKEKIELS